MTKWFLCHSFVEFTEPIQDKFQGIANSGEQLVSPP